jgi:hypothetical protein
VAIQEEIETSQERLEASQSSVRQSQQRLVEVRQEVSSAEARVESLQSERRSLEAQLVAVREEIETAQERLEVSRREFSSVQQRLSTLQGEIQTTEQQIATARTELRQLEERKTVEAEELQTLQVQYCSVQEDLSELEVGIRRLRGAQLASDAVQRCQFSDDTLEVERIERDEPVQVDNRQTDDRNASRATTVADTSQNQSVTLSNGYQITFESVRYSSSNTSVWIYRMEELPQAQDLSNWVLEIPSCAAIVNSSPGGEIVNPDPNARLSGIKWQTGAGFQDGVFSVTLNGQWEIGNVNVAAKGPDVVVGTVAGPSCTPRL